jgi:hypothetical protein
MEMQSRRVFRKPERPFVAEEMNFMPAPREFLAEAGRENPAAAHRRITRDADLHLIFNRE